MAGEHGCGKWLVVGAGRGLLSLAGRFVARLQVVACVHAQATAVRCITVTWHGRVWRLSKLLTPGQWLCCGLPTPHLLFVVASKMCPSTACASSKPGQQVVGMPIYH
jgi:hypothetical protein